MYSTCARGQGLGVPSYLQWPPVIRLRKIRASRPCLVARAEVGRGSSSGFEPAKCSRQRASATPSF